MGGGCYKATNLAISKEDVLRAINEQYISETIQTDANRNQSSAERIPSSQAKDTTSKVAKLKVNKVMHLDPSLNSAASTGATTLPMKSSLFTAEDE